jgi:hypothetical protein
LTFRRFIYVNVVGVAVAVAALDWLVLGWRAFICLDLAALAAIGLARSEFTQRQNVMLVVANVVGIVVFLWLGSWTWWPAEERRLGIYSITAEPFIWAISALPVLAICFLLNVSWGIVILSRRQCNSGRNWLLVAMIWFTALAIDIAHR